MKRHSFEEISDKLRKAAELAGQGRSQSEICKALGVSVMTFHRWRKSAHAAGKLRPTTPAAAVEGTPGGMENHSAGSFIQDLELENKRLRRIVADLLLEKSKIEEMLEKRVAGKDR